VPLRFGAAEFAAGEAVTGTLAAALPAPDLPGLVLIATAITETELFRDIGPAVIAPHAERDDGGGRAAIGQRSAQPTASRTLAAQQHAAPLAVGQRARQTATLAMQQGAAAPHTAADPLAVGQRAHYAEATRTQRRGTAPHQHGHPLRRGAAASYAEAIRTRRRARADHQHGTPTVRPATTRHATGRPIAAPRAERHQHMLPLPVGWWQATYPWPEPPFDPNAPSSPVALRFCRLADGTTALVFGCPQPAPQPGGIIVPIRRAYLVLNTITLARASDGAPLSALSLSLQIDTDSWTWGWDASIPGAELALVEPAPGGDPVELLATVNGQQFRLLAERIARDRRFAQSRIRISGRGRAAMLADPHSPIVTRSNADARTMQQLLADALTINNVGIGWAVDWQAADWVVPAGLYNHTGSYIAHAQRLAEAAGAYVQADPLLDTLRILPRYPLLPWEWSAATPDITLPSAPVVREAIEWQDKAAYNRVFVSGAEAGGVLGQITRTGTAGDVVAPMITDPLITHADGARARGRPILADTGRQARITLELPILPETGIITPGKLVQYTDAGTTRRGLVRSTAVTAQLPTARQTIELETHA
jgi:hypothetical protein